MKENESIKKKSEITIQKDDSNRDHKKIKLTSDIEEEEDLSRELMKLSLLKNDHKNS